MIVQVRVDDRLIHGQVALVWSKELNTKHIIVANDAAVESDALRMTLQMATPAGQKLLVKTVDDAIRLAKDPRGKEMRIFALTNCMKDVLALVKGAPGCVAEVNVANVGRFDKSDPAIPYSSTGPLWSTPMNWQLQKSCVSRASLCFTSSFQSVERLLSSISFGLLGNDWTGL